MSEPKFTKGPWFIDVNTMFDKVFIMCKENLPVNCGFIAEMADTNKNREADTNLIAAAPDMYEALKEACLDCLLEQDKDLCDFCYIGKALRKARGETDDKN